MAYFIKSQRASDILVFNGYSYQLHHKASDVKDYSVWNCALRKKKECPARVYFYDLQKIENPGNLSHSHPPDSESIGVKNDQNQMKEMATEKIVPGRQIIRTVVTNVPEPIIQKLPELGHVRRNISRWKHSNLNFNPQSVAEIDLDPVLWLTSTGEQMIYHIDPPEEPSRMIIFATPRNIEILQQSKIWIGDGTFEVYIPFL